MITTRKFLRWATLMTVGALLACGDDVTIPVAPPPITPDPVIPARVFTSVEILSLTSPLVALPALDIGWLEVRAKDQDGRRLVVERGSFTISSNNPNVLTVGEETFWTVISNGVQADSWISARITAVNTGEAVISVSWTVAGVTKTAALPITVQSLAGWSLRVSPSALTVQLGRTKPIEAWLLDASGKPRISYNAFTPDRDGVVSLFEDEACLYWVCHDINVRGVAVGETTLTAQFHSLSAKIAVTVVP